MNNARRVTLSDISEMPDEAALPPLDRSSCDLAQLNDHQRSWRENGVVILPKFLPDELIDAYCELRERMRNRDGSLNRGGWACPSPYMYYRELRDICLYPALMDVMRSLISEPMGLHLTLTGWISSTRDWHQDDYLNPPFVNSWYSAVWMALDDIHPDAGPFEYVPGSHRWPLLRRELVWNHLTEEERSLPSWPTIAERVCTPAFEEQIRVTNSEVQKFLGRRGDVLIWHGRLAHRGSLAKDPKRLRKGLVAHYSAVSKRKDMTQRRKWGPSDYFAFNTPLDAGSPPATVSDETPPAPLSLRRKFVSLFRR